MRLAPQGYDWPVDKRRLMGDPVPVCDPAPVWHAASDDGRTGVVALNAGSVAVELEGRDPVGGALTRNNPLHSISLLELEGKAHSYYWVGNDKLTLANGNDGYFLVYRE